MKFIAVRKRVRACTRVISLLYKNIMCEIQDILCKTIVNRLAAALPYIFDKDQTSGVKGKNISWNIQLHIHVWAF